MQEFNSLEKKIKAVSKLKGISIRKLCSLIGMTENGFSAALKNNTLKIATIGEIAKQLDVSTHYLLDEIDVNLTDEEINNSAELAIKLKTWYPINQTSNELKEAILFYEKNAIHINAQDFLLDLVFAIKSNSSISSIIEKYQKKIELIGKLL